MRLQIWRPVVFHTFNFSSATRGYLWNLTALFSSMDHWSKSWSSDFFKVLYELNYRPEHHEWHLKDNCCTFLAIIKLIGHLSKIGRPTFWPMVHRWKKYSEISEVTSGGGAEIENVKNDRLSDLHFHLRQQMLLSKSHCTFYIYGALGKRPFYQNPKR